MSSIVPFAYGDQSVRVLNLNGEPWFVLADLARVLGLRQFRAIHAVMSEAVMDALAEVDEAAA